MRQLLCLSISLVLLSGVAHANEQDFSSWLNGVRSEAKSKGVSDTILDQALGGISPIPRVIELDRKQPEGTMTFAQYKDRVISRCPYIAGTQNVFPI